MTCTFRRPKDPSGRAKERQAAEEAAGRALTVAGPAQPATVQVVSAVGFDANELFDASGNSDLLVIGAPAGRASGGPAAGGHLAHKIGAPGGGPDRFPGAQRAVRGPVDDEPFLGQHAVTVPAQQPADLLRRAARQP